jgi:hypothetical protein
VFREQHCGERKADATEVFGEQTGGARKADDLSYF